MQPSEIRDHSQVHIYLLSHEWRLKRGDGSVVASQIRFGHGGRIWGHTHSNEAAWRVRDGVLEFVNKAGEATTRFGSLARLPDGRIGLIGKFLPDPSGMAAHILESVRNLLPWRKDARAAVLVRTHIANEKLFDLLDSLQNGFGYHVYIAADTTRREFPIEDPHVLGHSEEMCRELGLSLNHFRKDFGALWTFGDYALYCSYEQKPDYDFYLMLEYDVHLTRKNPLFIEGLLNRLLSLPEEDRIDYVSPEFRPEIHFPDWMGVPPRDFRHYFSLVNFFVISKRALVHLYKMRKQWANGAPPELEQWFVESFVPSVLAAEDAFKCRQLNSIFPGSYALGKSYFGSNLPFLLGSNFEPDPRIEIVHPVLAAPEYLQAHLNRAVRTNTVKSFLDTILFNKELPISLQLREQFFTHAVSTRPKP